MERRGKSSPAAWRLDRPVNPTRCKIGMRAQASSLAEMAARHALDNRLSLSATTGLDRWSPTDRTRLTFCSLFQKSALWALFSVYTLYQNTSHFQAVKRERNKNLRLLSVSAYMPLKPKESQGVRSQFAMVALLL